MKKTLLLFLVLFCLRSSAQIGTMNYLDETNGLPDIKLGDTITALKYKTIPSIGAASPGKYGIIKYSIASPSKLTLGNEVVIKGINVSYLDGKVFDIEIFFDGIYSLTAIEILKKAYGPPTTNTYNTDQSMIWLGKKASAFFRFDLVEKNQIISLSSNKLMAVYNSRHEASILEATKDL